MYRLKCAKGDDAYVEVEQTVLRYDEELKNGYIEFVDDVGVGTIAPHLIDCDDKETYDNLIAMMGEYDASRVKTIFNTYWGN